MITALKSRSLSKNFHIISYITFKIITNYMEKIILTNHTYGMVYMDMKTRLYIDKNNIKIISYIISKQGSNNSSMI